MNIMESCRRKNKFTVVRLKTEDFLSVEPILKSTTNRKQGTKKEKISWLNTCEIELRKDVPLTLFMKQS